MKKKNIFAFILIFTTFVFGGVSLFAGGQGAAKRGIRHFPNTYLDETVFDYLLEKDFNFYIISYEDKNANTITEKVSKQTFKSEGAISAFLQPKVDEIYSDKKGITGVAEQFDIMSFLMNEGDNETLESVLNSGWDPRIRMTIGNSAERSLFSQAVLANNKEALAILRAHILANGTAFEQNKDAVKEILITDLYHTLSNFVVPSNCYECVYNKRTMEDKHFYAENNFNAETIAQMVINGDEGALLAVFDIALNTKKDDEVLFEALNKLIDYRVYARI